LGDDGSRPTQDPISKITRAKWTGDVAQAVEHLPSNCEALSSNPSAAKKQNKNNNYHGHTHIHTHTYTHTLCDSYCAACHICIKLLNLMK
jgi:hypothetical protein